MLVHFRKLPFTCAFPSFEQNAVVGALVWVVGFIAFTAFVPAVEHWALSRRPAAVVFVPMWALGWYVLRKVRQDTMEIDQKLIFEEVPTRAVEVLQLGNLG